MESGIDKMIHASSSAATRVAVSIQSKLKTALTLTLSPRRGNHSSLRFEHSLDAGIDPVLDTALPLLGERVGVSSNFRSTESAGLNPDK